MTGESLEERRRQILATHEIVHRIGCTCPGPSEAIELGDFLRAAQDAALDLALAALPWCDSDDCNCDHEARDAIRSLQSVKP